MARKIGKIPKVKSPNVSSIAKSMAKSLEKEVKKYTSKNIRVF
tara:strand:- start:138 stop:266 length:129 start_codon:yes stop_codon:yes gene_type:complete